MKLYHGTNHDFHQIDLAKSLPYKDFGRGFYLTDLEPQAEPTILFRNGASH